MSLILRAERRALMLIASGKTCLIPFEHYGLLERILKGNLPNGEKEAFAATLENSGFLAWMRENPELVRKEMELSANLRAPENAYVMPTLLNLELTTRCPLRCPQCYCDMRQGKDLPLERALTVIKQAAEYGVANINLSGGETMLYPHLYSLLAECSSLNLSAAVALSGYGVDISALRRMIACGVSEIYVSLNGSTEEISAVTRDGFHFAIQALEQLKQIGFEETGVNWVAHRNNIADFSNVAALCNKFKVKRLVVIAFKPDASHRIESAPDGTQLLVLAQNIRRLREDFPNISIEVESCYSPLRALLSQNFFGNTNRGISKGCGAGRDGVSLNVDGNFSPCRHLDYPESFEDISDYWYNSDMLRQLREVENTAGEPCLSCGYGEYCLSCLAINYKLLGKIAKADRYCMLWKQTM